MTTTKTATEAFDHYSDILDAHPGPLSIEEVAKLSPERHAAKELVKTILRLAYLTSPLSGVRVVHRGRLFSYEDGAFTTRPISTVADLEAQLGKAGV